MAKRLIEYDAETKTQVWHDYDPLTDTTTIAEIQDCAPALDSAKALRNYGQGGAKGLNEYSKAGIKNNLWHVATIPNHVIVEWRQKYHVDVFNKHQAKEVAKLLNNSDYAYLRTGTGIV